MTKICSVEGCPRPVLARGWCNNHYALWRRNGVPEPLANPASHTTYFESYTSMHNWLYKYRGRAQDMLCVDCGKQAQQWSYDNDCPDEKLDPYAQGFRAYCPHPEHYQPRCFACHNTRDRHKRSKQGSRNPQAKLTEDQVLEIQLLHATGEKTRIELSQDFNLSYGHIASILSRRVWKHVTRLDKLTSTE